MSVDDKEQAAFEKLLAGVATMRVMVGMKYSRMIYRKNRKHVQKSLISGGKSWICLEKGGKRVKLANFNASKLDNNWNC